VTCFSGSRKGDIDVDLAAHGHDSLGLNSALCASLSVGRYKLSMINPFVHWVVYCNIITRSRKTSSGKLDPKEIITLYDYVIISFVANLPVDGFSLSRNMLHSTIQCTKGVVIDGFCPPVCLFDKGISHIQ
jgi:hypothetical protein